MAGAASGAPRRRPTLREVAAAAGVSTATVSRALRDDPQISLPTREAVKRIAAELQYVPNAAARSLASSSSRMLGLIVPDVTDPVHGQVVQGFESIAMQHGYTVVIANSAYDPDLELAALRVFAANLVEGTATFGGMLHPGVVGSEGLGNVVYMNPEEPGALAAATGRGLITIDDVGGMEDAVRTAAGMGNRRLGFVAGPVRASCARRREAVLRAAADLNLPTVLVIEAEDVPLADAAARLRGERLDAVLCYDDQRALRLLDALRAEGVRVPEDLGVIGFDDIPQAAISNPRLTTVSVPHPEIGSRAAEALITGAGGQLPPSVQVPATLVVRESLGPPARA